MKIMRHALFSLSFAVATLAITASAANPCEMYATSPFGSLSRALECESLLEERLRDVNDLKATYTATIVTLRGFLEGYSFRDMAQNSGPPYNIKVDILGGLDALLTAVSNEATPRKSRKFHDDIGDILMKLKDAHTTYIKPSCFATTTIIPVLLGSRLEASTGEQEVFMRGTIDLFVKLYDDWIAPNKATVSASDFKDYVGLKVIAIDGNTNVVGVISDLETMISKDEGAQFNWQLGNFFLRNGGVFKLPESDFVTLTFEGGKELKLYWAAFQPHFSELTSVVDMAKLCESSTASRKIRSRSSLPSTKGIEGQEEEEEEEEEEENVDVRGILRKLLLGPVAKTSKSPAVTYMEEHRQLLTQAAEMQNEEKKMKMNRKNNNNNKEEKNVAAAPLRARVTGPKPMELPADYATTWGSKIVDARRGKDINSKKSTAIHTLNAVDAAKNDYTLAELHNEYGWAASFAMRIKGTSSSDPPTACVMRVPSFSPVAIPDENGGACETQDCQMKGIEQALSDMQKSIDAMAEGKCPRIAIDVNGNPGGAVCLGYRLYSQLIRASEAKADGIYDVITSKWAEALITFADEKGYNDIGLAAFLDPKTGEPMASTKDLFDGEKYTRGGAESTYWRKSMLPCTEFPQLDAPKLFFPSSKIGVFADGLCGSTCEMFVHKLRKVGSVKAAGMGGFWNAKFGRNSAKAVVDSSTYADRSEPVPMDPSSFAGGNVYQMSTLQNAFSALASEGLETSLMPPMIPTSADLSFNWRELYAFNLPDRVLEWYHSPSEVRIPVWASQDPTGRSAVDPTVWPAGVESAVFTDATTCEEGTAVPCDIGTNSGKTGWFRVCEGGLLHNTSCTDSAPAAPSRYDRPSSKSVNSGSTSAHAVDLFWTYMVMTFAIALAAAVF